MTVFLPWPGHFGDLIRDVLPWLWATWKPGDLLGGNPAHAPLYPGPIDARLWAPIARAFPDGYDYRREADDWEGKVRRLAVALHPGHYLATFIPGRPDLFPRPAMLVPGDPILVDVVLAPRRKPYIDAKNGWPWADLAARLRAQGLTVGLAGTPAESDTCPANLRAWDFDQPGDAVTGTLRLLSGARLVVSQDSAIAHLAALLDRPQLILYPRPGDHRRRLPIRDAIPTQMRFHDCHAWNRALCLPIHGGPAEVADAILEALNRTILADGRIADWQARPVVNHPDHRPGRTLVLREPDRLLVMRPVGNRLIPVLPLDDDLPSVPPDAATIAARTVACHTCPDHQPGPDRCRRCGCGFVVAERTRSPFARCPASRWPR